MRHLAILVLSLLALSPDPAHGAELACGPAEAGAINLDGFADDWREAPAMQGDAGLSVHCNTQGKTLYLAIEVQDERVVRTKDGRDGEDHVTLRLGEQRFTLFPNAGTYKQKAVPAIKMASSSNDAGFVIEVAIPFSRLPGLGRGLERLPIGVRFDDCDAAATLKTERTVKVDGELAFTEGPSTLDTFLADRGLSRSLVRWKRPLRVGKVASQLVLVGRLVAVVGDGYAYVELPVSDGTDVRDPRLVDLAGDGRPTLLVEYTERGDGGQRIVLAAFRVEGKELKRVFAVEVGKRTSTGELHSKVELKKRGRATDIVLVAQPAAGFTADNYKEAPASDVLPILLPWSAQKKATFSFTKDGYQQK